MLLENTFVILCIFVEQTLPAANGTVFWVCFSFGSVRFGSYGKFRFFVFFGGGVGLSLFVFKKKNAKHVALDEPARCEQTNRRFEYFATKQPKVALIVPTESSSQASFPIRMIIPPIKSTTQTMFVQGGRG